MMTREDHLRILSNVDLLAAESKDRSTGIGAVLWPWEGDEAIIQCNALPDGIKDTDARSERPAKYFYWEHAERNVIYEAAKHGIPTNGSILFTTGVPCADCARACIQAGISEVVVWSGKAGVFNRPGGETQWGASIAAGREMLEEAGVKITEVEREHAVIA